MAKPIEINILSRKSIENAIKAIDNYEKELTDKCEEVCRELAEIGINTAKGNTGNYGKYIAFTTKTEPSVSGCVAIAMVASNTGIIKSEWLTKDGVKSADVSPLLMCEFGSGLRAQNPNNIPGVGTGTFPGQTHAEDPGGWYYMDLDGVWHHSSGVTPSMPMYNAWKEMFSNAESIVRKVFKT